MQVNEIKGYFIKIYMYRLIEFLTGVIETTPVVLSLIPLNKKKNVYT